MRRADLLATTLATVLTLTAASQATRAAASDAPVGRWSIVSTAHANSVQLRLEYAEVSGGSSWSGVWSSEVALADAGIAPGRLRGAAGAVTFDIRREPGTFACTGSAGDGQGAGTFTYAANERFDDALASRGVGRPSPRQSLELATANVTLAFVDSLRASAANVTVADVVRIVQHGISPRYVADLAGAGYAASSPDQFVRLHDHGISVTFVRALQAAGYKNLTADDLVTLHDHGVSAEYVAKLKAHGYANVSVRDLIRLREAGI